MGVLDFISKPIKAAAAPALKPATNDIADSLLATATGPKDILTANSTKAVADKTTPNTAAIFSGQSQVRPAFAKEGEEQPVGGGALGNLAVNTVERAKELIPKVAVQAAENIYNWNHPDKNVSLPFDPARLGLSKNADGTVESSGNKYTDALDKIGYNYENPSPMDVVRGTWEAIKGPLGDVLDTLGTESLVKGGAKEVLAHTGYNPAVSTGLQKLGLAGDTDVSVQKIKEAFLTKAQNIIEYHGGAVSPTGQATGVPIKASLELNELGQATHDVLQAVTGKGIPQLSTLGKVAENTARALTEDINTAGRSNLANEVGTHGVEKPEALPGYRPTNPNLRPLGLSTQEVEPVGFGDENKTPEGASGGELYHGSEKPIDSFDITKARNANYGKGIYLSDNPQLAAYYSTIKTKGTDLKNASVDDLGKLNTRLGSVQKISLAPDAKIKTLTEDPSQKQILQAKEDGFDGVKFKDTIEKEDWDSKVLGDPPKDGNTTLLFNADKIVTSPAKPFDFIKQPISKVIQSSPSNVPKTPIVSPKEFLKTPVKETIVAHQESLKNAAKTPNLSGEIEQKATKIKELKANISILQDEISRNPAQGLKKYISKSTGRLPEVVGEGGKYGTSGDDLAKSLGFADTEDAQLHLDNLQLQEKRLKDMRGRLKESYSDIALSKTEDKDAKSIGKLLNKRAKEAEKEAARIASENNKPEAVEKRMQERKVQAKENMKKIVEGVHTLLPEIQLETPGFEGDATKEAYDLTLEDHEKLAEGDPLNQIFDDYEKPVTPLQQKVSIIDQYLRTPDRVLKMMKLGNIAADLRSSYEGYLAELPEHINLITDWADRTGNSKQANLRIFKWLDGDYNRDYHAGKVMDPLSPDELQIAREIQAYLKEWAYRLGLPDDNRITHYITHIFGISENEAEFDEDVAKIIDKQIPGSVHDPFLEKRLGKKGYIQNTWKALDAYVKRAVRKANMDPVLEKIKAISPRMELGQQEYLERLSKNINMQPSKVDNAIDIAVKKLIGYKLGQRPTAFVSQFARKWVSRAMLGLNFTSAIKNLTQGVNTYAKLGEKYTAIGYTNLITKWGGTELQDSGVLGQDIVQDKTISAIHKYSKKADTGLYFMFELAEKINRGAAYWGAKAKALDEGATEEEAKESAKKLVRDTQFNFGSIDTPAYLNSDIAKTVTQFATFGIKQVEFAQEMFNNKEWAGIARYIAASFFIVATIGSIFGIKATDLIPGASFMKFGWPPILAFPGAILSAAVDQKDPFGQPRSLSKKLGDIVNAIPFPAAIQLKKTVPGIIDFIKGQGGKGTQAFKIDQTPINLAKLALLGPNAVSGDAKKVKDSSILDTVLTYAHAVGVDPATAFNRIFTGQTIKRVDNGTVIVERMSLADSTAVKEERGANNSGMKLDHTVPLELGGSNSKDNLKIVTTDEWASYTPIENLLGQLLRGDKINKNEAQSEIQDFKDGKITAQSLFDKYGEIAKDLPPVSDEEDASQDDVSNFQKASQQNAVDNKNARIQFQDTYDHIQSLITAGKTDEAQSIVNSLSDDDYATYKKIKAAQKSKDTSAKEASMMSTVQKVQDLVKQGKQTDAQAIVDALTDDEYKIYQLAKKRLGY